MSELTLREVLEQSREHIKSMWVCGEAGHPGEQCCTITAISQSLGLIRLDPSVPILNHYQYPMSSNSVVAKDAIEALYEALPKNIKARLDEYDYESPDTRQDILVGYNDDFARRQEDIVALYDRAIEALPDE